MIRSFLLYLHMMGLLLYNLLLFLLYVFWQIFLFCKQNPIIFINIFRHALKSAQFVVYIYLFCTLFICFIFFIFMRLMAVNYMHIHIEQPRRKEELNVKCVLCWRTKLWRIKFQSSAKRQKLNRRRIRRRIKSFVYNLISIFFLGPFCLFGFQHFPKRFLPSLGLCFVFWIVHLQNESLPVFFPIKSEISSIVFVSFWLVCCLCLFSNKNKNVHYQNIFISIRNHFGNYYY